MRRLEMLAVGAGTVLAVFVLAGAVAQGSPDAGEVRAVANVEKTVPLPATEMELVLPPPPPIVEELPVAVAGVLAEHGHTELMPRSALLDALPPAVVGVLIEHGVVLRVSDTEARLP